MTKTAQRKQKRLQKELEREVREKEARLRQVEKTPPPSSKPHPPPPSPPPPPAAPPVPELPPPDPAAPFSTPLSGPPRGAAAKRKLRPHPPTPTPAAAAAAASASPPSSEPRREAGGGPVSGAAGARPHGPGPASGRAGAHPPRDEGTSVPPSLADDVALFVLDALANVPVYVMALLAFASSLLRRTALAAYEAGCFAMPQLRRMAARAALSGLAATRAVCHHAAVYWRLAQVHWKTVYLVAISLWLIYHGSSTRDQAFAALRDIPAALSALRQEPLFAVLFRLAIWEPRWWASIPLTVALMYWPTGIRYSLWTFTLLNWFVGGGYTAVTLSFACLAAFALLDFSPFYGLLLAALWRLLLFALSGWVNALMAALLGYSALSFFIWAMEESDTRKAKQPARGGTANPSDLEGATGEVLRVLQAEDLYDVLSLTRPASDADVKGALKRLRLLVHPDKTGAGDDPTRRGPSKREPSANPLSKPSLNM